MKTFEREFRYLVAKIKDIDKYLTPVEKKIFYELHNKIDIERRLDGRPVLECVCVEHDWPEYKPVWKMIETRVLREGGE